MRMFETCCNKKMTLLNADFGITASLTCWNLFCNKIWGEDCEVKRPFSHCCLGETVETLKRCHLWIFFPTGSHILYHLRKTLRWKRALFSANQVLRCPSSSSFSPTSLHYAVARALDEPSAFVSSVWVGGRWGQAELFSWTLMSLWEMKWLP